MARPALVPALLLGMAPAPLAAAEVFLAVQVEAVAMNEPHWAPPTCMAQVEDVLPQRLGRLILQAGGSAQPQAEVTSLLRDLHRWFKNGGQGVVLVEVFSKASDINRDGVPDVQAIPVETITYEGCIPDVLSVEKSNSQAGASPGNPAQRLSCHFRYATYNWVSSHQ